MAKTDNMVTSPNYDIDVVDRYLRAMDEDTRTVDPAEMATLEARFVEAAARFARCYLISAGAWSDVGLSVDLIQRAGLDQ
jgi:hypothetical protein